nr:unnamed protein product [Callosobruchus chinensis]
MSYVLPLKPHLKLLMHISEALNIISSLKNRKSSGHDNIPSEVYKKVNDEIALPLCHLINKIFLTNIVPKHHKLLTTNYDKTFCVPFSNTARCLPQYQQKAR